MSSESLPRLSYEDPSCTHLLDIINPLRITDREKYIEYIEGRMQEGTYDVWIVDVGALDQGTTCYRLAKRRHPDSEWALPHKQYWVEQVETGTFVSYAQAPLSEVPSVLWVDSDPATCLRMVEEDLAACRDENISTRA